MADVDQTHCKEIPSGLNIYICGGCIKTFTTICQLHKHLLNYHGGGSYFYNHTTHEAFPRFDLTCQSTQTAIHDEEQPFIIEIVNDALTSNVSEKEKSTIKEEAFDCKNAVSEYSPPVKRSIGRKGKSRKGKLEQTMKRKVTNKPRIPASKRKLKKEKTIINTSPVVKPKESERSSKCVCKICDRQFRKKMELKHHILTDHKDLEYKCLKCCEAFDSGDSFQEHNAKVHSKGGHQCELCNKILSTKAMLEGHYLVHKGIKPFSCDICVPKRRFTRKSQLKSHMETHSEEKHLQCEFCGKPFNARYLMLNHVKHCGGIKPHKCDFCEMSFVSNHCLQKHRRVHTGEKPFVCEICAFASSNASCLNRHMRRHTGEKPYSCPHCQMKFACRSAMKKHTRVHTHEKPYICSFCSKSFTQKWNLKTHERQHTGETPYKCNVCGIGFKQNVLLKTHIKSHFGTPSNTSYSSKDMQEKVQEIQEPLRLELQGHQLDTQGQQPHYGISNTSSVHQQVYQSHQQQGNIDQMLLSSHQLHLQKLDPGIQHPSASHLLPFDNLHPVSGISLGKAYSKVSSL